MTHKYYNVCTANKGSDDKTRFTKIGVAFPGKEDGKAFMNIKLEALPLDGELVLFAPKEKEDDAVVD